MQLLSLLHALLPEQPPRPPIILNQVHEVRVLRSVRRNVLLFGDHHTDKTDMDSDQSSTTTNLEIFLQQLFKARPFRLLLERHPDRRDIDDQSRNINAVYKAFKDHVVLCDLRPSEITFFLFEAMALMDGISSRVREKKRGNKTATKNAPTAANKQWIKLMTDLEYKAEIKQIIDGKGNNKYTTESHYPVLPAVKAAIANIDEKKHRSVHALLTDAFNGLHSYFSDPKHFTADVAAFWKHFCEIKEDHGKAFLDTLQLPRYLLEVVESYLVGTEAEDFISKLTESHLTLPFWKPLTNTEKWTNAHRILQKWAEKSSRIMDLFVEASLFDKSSSASDLYVFLGGYSHVHNIDAFLHRQFGPHIRFDHAPKSPFRGDPKRWICPFLSFPDLLRALH